LTQVIQDGSCKRIKQTGGASGNGTYTINPTWAWEFKVYCDMETNGWGWTLVARSVTGGTWDFPSALSGWSLSDDSILYKINSGNQISYEEEMLTTYVSWKIIVNQKKADKEGSIYTVWDHTLEQWWITWWVTDDGYNWEQWMLFVK
jgi:hypothetical protein